MHRVQPTPESAAPSLYTGVASSQGTSHPEQEDLWLDRGASFARRRGRAISDVVSTHGTVSLHMFGLRLNAGRFNKAWEAICRVMANRRRAYTECNKSGNAQERREHQLDHEVLGRRLVILPEVALLLCIVEIQHDCLISLRRRCRQNVMGEFEVAYNTKSDAQRLAQTQNAIEGGVVSSRRFN